MTSRKRVLIIGAGNMGSALAFGLTRSSKQQCELMIHDQHKEKTNQFSEIHKIVLWNDLAPERLAKASKDAQFSIVLCVKPHDLAAVAEQLAGHIPTQTTVISILAGIPLQDIRRQLKLTSSEPAVRAMPNIAATVGEAATVLCTDGELTPEQQELSQLIFESVGMAYWSKESLLDAVTGLSGSGPAYIYMIIEALTDGGVKMGIPRLLAKDLAVQTVVGAGTLVKKTGLHPAVLKEQVTTPGGTTIHAIHELEARGLRAMIMSAVETATRQSTALSTKTKS